jgi:hypothetical protein
MASYLVADLEISNPDETSRGFSLDGLPIRIHACVHQHILLCNPRLLFLCYSAGRNSAGLGRTEHGRNPY